MSLCKYKIQSAKCLWMPVQRKRRKLPQGNMVSKNETAAMAGERYEKNKIRQSGELKEKKKENTGYTRHVGTGKSSNRYNRQIL